MGYVSGSKAPDARFDAQDYWRQTIKGNQDAYKEFKMGCKGLCNVRYGLPFGNMPWMSAKLFSTYDAADTFAKAQGPDRRIFALYQMYIFDPISIDKNQPKLLTVPQVKALGEVVQDKNAVLFRAAHGYDSGPYDFGTLHKPTKDKKSWFFESMSQSYSAQAKSFAAGKTNTKFPSVIHRPFLDVIAWKNIGNYKYVIFGVVKVGSNAIVPPTNE